MEALLERQGRVGRLPGAQRWTTTAAAGPGCLWERERGGGHLRASNPAVKFPPCLFSFLQGPMSQGCSRQQEIPFPLLFTSFPSLSYGGLKCFLVALFIFLF